MARSPFPQGTVLPDGAVLGRAVTAKNDTFWIHSTKDGRRALIVADAFAVSLFGKPSSTGDEVPFMFGAESYQVALAKGPLDVLDRLQRPQSQNEAMAFARALAGLPDQLGQAIYSEGMARLLLLDGDDCPLRDKADILGRYLTGGVEVSAADIVALHRILPKIDLADLQQIVAAAGVKAKSPISTAGKWSKRSGTASKEGPTKSLVPFVLPGRQALSAFFNEHVVDVVADADRYAALGIGFPGGIVLEGPTGCGKTFAVERLIEHL